MRCWAEEVEEGGKVKRHIAKPGEKVSAVDDVDRLGFRGELGFAPAGRSRIFMIRSRRSGVTIRWEDDANLSSISFRQRARSVCVRLLISEAR